MECVNIKFDPQVDISEVDQFGYIDLPTAYINSVVVGDASFSPNQFNGLDDPKSIGSKPTDVFEAMRAASALKAVGKSTADKNKVVVDN